MARQLITSIQDHLVSSKYDLNLEETLDSLPIKTKHQSFFKEVLRKLKKNTWKANHKDPEAK